MESESRLQWLREHVCDSLAVEPALFDKLVEDSAAVDLLTSFLDGVEPLPWHMMVGASAVLLHNAQLTIAGALGAHPVLFFGT